MKRILVPTSSLISAYEAAEYTMRIASVLKAEVHLLHVFADEESQADCSDVFQMFELAAEENNILVRKATALGHVAEEINRYSENHEINLILMGASNGRVVEEWTSYEVLGHSSIPVLVMPYQLFEFVFPFEQIEFSHTQM